MPSNNQPGSPPVLVPLWTREEIAKSVATLARNIDRDYVDCTPVLVGALKGAFIFMADLVRELQTPVEIEFMRLSSYGTGTESSGDVQIEFGPSREAIEGRSVIVVEDIIDTGLTTTAALEHLNQYDPSSLRICTLLDRPERRLVELEADYAGFTFTDHFVVGYGLDLDQKYRQLPGIYGLETDA
ncbi:MAG: hypoxanthine phosphoribosyltransferase [Chloroflexi bacterium]|nr:hypoxanthine phosphoribosyltransferase [Chloroflexota bacterium]MBT4072483.1 hypoxanthine phosphoribosyltransferase [Chloroflexota bacterium]MBT5318789.1 hypoxanthine phosphoribosyltransferase [Chloroflexota bacterium]MBT6681657.1 hypoxanthine phosphoribosyltransferase [Chloroflexota bacterium]